MRGSLDVRGLRDILTTQTSGALQSEKYMQTFRGGVCSNTTESQQK